MPWENNRPTHVPTPLRDACIGRDGNRCTAIQQDGTRCPETTQLEAAHIQQWQPGEQLTLDQLRTLCHWHHNRETQREAAAARAATTPRPTARAAHPTELHPAFRTTETTARARNNLEPDTQTQTRPWPPDPPPF